jgi:hypothetical protein
MIEIVRRTERNVKRWSSGEMALRRPRSRYRPRQHHHTGTALARFHGERGILCLCLVRGEFLIDNREATGSCLPAVVTALGVHSLGARLPLSRVAAGRNKRIVERFA